jgi:hypothetical protein
MNISLPQVADPKDVQKGAIAAGVVVALLIIILFIITYQIADPPPQDIVVKTETTLDVLQLKNLKVESGSAGGGTSSNDPIKKPEQQIQKVITGKSEKSTEKTGQSNKTNGNNPNNEASTSSQSDNPFGTGGSGGGRGAGNGPFGGPGSGDEGDGGAGRGSGANRIRMNDPVLPSYDIDQDATLTLKLTINDMGEITGAIVVKSRSTLSDQRIINSVIAEIRRQVKYKADPGSPSAQVYLTVNVNSR